MTPAEISDLADRYFREEVSVTSPSTPDLTESWDQLATLLSRDPEAVFQVVIAVIAKCSNLVEISRVGTGPLESLLANNPERFSERLVALAADDRRIRQTLYYVAVPDLPKELERFVEGE